MPMSYQPPQRKAVLNKTASEIDVALGQSHNHANRTTLDALKPAHIEFLENPSVGSGGNGSPGADGRDGIDGITPHIGDNGNWWFGETDTGKPSRGESGKNIGVENDVLRAVISEKVTELGLQSGVDGRDGNDGVDGQNGSDGVTPHIGANGNWFIGGVDTGIRAQGIDGTNGVDGAQGIQGVQGERGLQGETGATGPQGIPGATFDYNSATGVLNIITV